MPPFVNTVDFPWTLPADGYYPVTPPLEEEEFDPQHSIASSLNLSCYDTSNVTTPSSDIDDRQPQVAVIGVGYVGEHLVRVFSSKYPVIGYDVSEGRVQQLKKEFQTPMTLGKDEAYAVPQPSIHFTSTASDLSSATVFLIAVPTLLLPDGTVDTSYLRSAIATVGAHARRQAIVVVESSVAVGMTRTLLGPLAASRRLFAGMSPERVDPGRVDPPAHLIPKVISGLDDVVPGSLAAIQTLYSSVFASVVPVSRPEVAEMTKLYENCQRMMCIAFANEMADACGPHGVDPFEVAAAARTKPFGYLPMNPGLGVGGHCIPVNPFYLFSNCSFPLLRAATETMRARPSSLARRLISRLQENEAQRREAVAADRELVQDGEALTASRPRVLVVGIGFKAGQSHLANSPGLDLARSLAVSGEVDVCWADPLVSQASVPQIARLADQDWEASVLQDRFEAVVVACRQPGLDLQVLQKLRGVHVEQWCT